MLTPRERSSRTSPRSSHGPRTGWLSPLAPWPAGPQKRLARFSNREYFQSGMLWEKCPPGLGRAAAADRPRLDFACNTETQVRKEGAGVRAKPKERERAPPAKAVRLRVDETLVGECRRRIPSGAKGSPRRRRAPGRQRAERERAREGPRGPSVVATDAFRCALRPVFLATPSLARPPLVRGAGFLARVPSAQTSDTLSSFPLVRDPPQSSKSYFAGVELALSRRV